MNEDEILKFLKDNIEVEIKIRKVDYETRWTFILTLFFKGQEFCSAEDDLDIWL